MKAKFHTTECLNDVLRYTAPQALGAIILGLVLAVLGMAAGIAIMVVKSIIGGSLLLAALLILAIMVLYFGFVGANKMVKANTVLMNTTQKTIVFTEENVIEDTVGKDCCEHREFSYEYFSGAKYDKGLLVLYVTDGTSIVCEEGKLIEGDIQEIRTFLAQQFGKNYLEKLTKSQVAAAGVEDNQADVHQEIEEQSHEESAPLVDDGEEDSEDSEIFAR